VWPKPLTSASQSLSWGGGGGPQERDWGGKKVWKSVKPVLFLLVQTENACITKEKYIQTEHGSLFNKWRAVWHSLVLLVEPKLYCCAHSIWNYTLDKTLHFYLRTCTEAITTTFLPTISTKSMLTWIVLILTLYTLLRKFCFIIRLNKCKNLQQRAHAKRKQGLRN
jgi:hypothetical protein